MKRKRFLDKEHSLLNFFFQFIQWLYNTFSAKEDMIMMTVSYDAADDDEDDDDDDDDDDDVGIMM